MSQLYLYNSTICRLCGERSRNGIKLFMTDERDVSQLINRYLPLKVSIAKLLIVGISTTIKLQFISE